MESLFQKKYGRGDICPDLAHQAAGTDSIWGQHPMAQDRSKT